MSTGSVEWLVPSMQTVAGTVPSGQYNGSFRMDYCCMTGGAASQPISLPTHSPFFLFAHASQCQEVRGMAVSREYFLWDIPDYQGGGGRAVGVHPYVEIDHYGNVQMYFCYYDR